MKREKKKSPKTVTFKPLKKGTSQQNNIKSNILPLNIWVLIGLSVLIGFTAFSKYFSTEYLFFFKDIGSDSLNQNYPGIVQVFNLMQEEFFIKWSFYTGMGQNYAVSIPPEPYGILRQLTDLFGGSKFGADYFVFGRFIKIFVFYFLLSSIVFYFYLRTLSIKRFSSVIGSLLIGFSGYMVVGSSWGFASHVFKVVFLLFAFEQLNLKNRWYFFPFAIIWLSSNVFNLYIYSLFIFIYSVFRHFSKTENNFKQYVTLIWKMGLFGLVGLLMNFGEFLKSFLKLYNSPRVSGSVSYSKVLSGGEEIIEQTSLTATTILRFFSSDILGVGSDFQGWSNYLEAPLFYIGLLTLLLFSQVFIHLNKRKKIVFGSFLGFWILTIVFPYLRHAMLAFTGDYFRYGFDFFIPFTLLFFAVYSLNEIDKTFKINLKLLGGTLVTLFGFLFFPYASIPPLAIDDNIQKTIVPLLLLYSALIFTMSKPKYKKYGQIGILLLVIVELSYFSYKSYQDRVPVTKKEFIKDAGGYKDGTIQAVNYIKSIDEALFYRIEKDYQSGNTIHGSLNDAKAQGYYGTTSYSSFNQINYVRFLEEIGLIQKGDETSTRWITGFRNHPLLQSFANVKYHLSKTDEPLFLKFGFKHLAKIKGITILKNPYYLPFGYTYDKYIDGDDFSKLVNYKITQQSLQTINQDLSRTVVRKELDVLLKKLQRVVNNEYANLNILNSNLENILSTKEFNKYKITIAKYSVSNFRAQTALLNGFVYEKDTNVNLNEFKKINISDSSKTVSVEKFNFNVYKTFIDQLKQDTLQITSFKNSEITGNISLQKTKMLFFTIPYDKGWKIKVDGKENRLSRVSFGFTGVVMPKGEHKIKLYYIPEYYYITNLISIISIVGFWMFLAFYFYKKKKNKNN